jgi:hypothetical protein
MEYKQMERVERETLGPKWNPICHLCKKPSGFEFQRPIRNKLYRKDIEGLIRWEEKFVCTAHHAYYSP